MSKVTIADHTTTINGRAFRVSQRPGRALEFDLRGSLGARYRVVRASKPRSFIVVYANPNRIRTHPYDWRPRGMSDVYLTVRDGRLEQL